MLLIRTIIERARGVGWSILEQVEVGWSMLGAGWGRLK